MVQIHASPVKCLRRSMKKINIELNFCRVFEIPEEYPEGFCFSGGKKVEFLMVDWFNPLPTIYFDGVWSDELKNKLISFLKEKRYVKKGKRYVCITDFNESFIIKKDSK